MATVDDLRNEIREAVGRHERIESTGFTKEALAAIADAVGADVGGGSRPGTAATRTAIRRRVDGLDGEVDGSRGFRKAELETIASALRTD